MRQPLDELNVKEEVDRLFAQLSKEQTVTAKQIAEAHHAMQTSQHDTKTPDADSENE